MKKTNLLIFLISAFLINVKGQYQSGYLGRKNLIEFGFSRQRLATFTELVQKDRYFYPIKQTNNELYYLEFSPEKLQQYFLPEVRLIRTLGGYGDVQVGFSQHFGKEVRYLEIDNFFKGRTRAYLSQSRTLSYIRFAIYLQKSRGMFSPRGTYLFGGINNFAQTNKIKGYMEEWKKYYPSTNIAYIDTLKHDDVTYKMNSFGLNFGIGKRMLITNRILFNITFEAYNLFIHGSAEHPYLNRDFLVYPPDKGKRGSDLIKNSPLDTDYLRSTFSLSFLL